MSDLQDKYYGIKSNIDMSPGYKKINTKKLEKRFGIYKQIDTDPPFNGDFDYDNYGTKGKYNRVQNRGSYSEIRLTRTERPTGDPNKFAKAISSKDTVIVADLRLGWNHERTDSIIKAINARTKTAGDVLFIGNLLSDKNKKAWPMLLDFVNAVYSNSLYLILGNNDFFSTKDYIDFGFTYVTDRAEKTVGNRRLIYTYYPVPVSPGQLNIHGHPHDDLYRLISHKGHVDAKVLVTTNNTRIYTLGDILKNS